MKIKIHIYTFLIVLFSFTAILAQNNKQKKNSSGQTVEKEVIKENGAGNVKTPQSTGDEINFKDENNNSLITITDEGTVGSITIPSAGSAPSTTTNKLYNIGSTLYFNGSAVGSGEADSINGLSDAISDGSNLFLGAGSGVSDDGSTNNTAVGINTLNANTSGSRNTAIGYFALYYNTTGYDNIANGYQALVNNIAGGNNTADGYGALYYNTYGSGNTAYGITALYSNTTGSNNTAIGNSANVALNNLTNATAIGYDATVNASNKIRLGNTSVSVIEGQVAYTYTSDSTKKENFVNVDGEKVLEKFRKFKLTSWNYKGNNPKTQRHYGIMAQVFYSAFGHDAMGTIGNDTTLNGGDVTGINMIAIQALEKRTEKQAARIEELEKQNAELKKEFENVNLIVNKLAGKQVGEHKEINVTYK